MAPGPADALALDPSARVVYIFDRSRSARAGITQLVECKLPKLDVAGSSPVARSILSLRGDDSAMALFRRDSPTPVHSSASGPSSGEPTGTRIAAGARFEGKISGAVDLRIDGELEGEIAVPAVVVVGPEGRVTGPISARVVRVAGRVTGDLRGTERVEIAATANLEGDIAAPRVTIAEGAFFKGRVEMKPASGAEAAAGAGANPQSSTTRARDGRTPEPPKGPRNG